jgi:hypothetical protein
MEINTMHAKRLTPILNVSNIQQTLAWFEKLGWTKAWDWGDPPTFGGVCSGECEIFLCQGEKIETGNRGKGEWEQIYCKCVEGAVAFLTSDL